MRGLSKTDFFTKEIDDLLLKGQIRVAIHSAKDLPDPLPEGLVIASLTQGLDPRDALVFNHLPKSPIIGTSSKHREAAVKILYPEARFVDIRGTISERIEKINQGEVDGVVIAEAALIRLKLTLLNRIYLPGETTPGQGRLAIVCKKQDHELIDFFSCITFST